jgi:hypothetical protein
MTKIAISLAAVLLLIVAIGYFAMRFLRADDTDEFDDRPAEPSRPRGRPGDQDRGPDSRTTVTAGRPGRGARGPADAAAPHREQGQPARRHTARAASEPRSGGGRSGGLDRAGSGTGGLDHAASGTGGLDRAASDTGGFDTGGFQNAGRSTGSRSAGSRSAGAGPDSSRPARGRISREFASRAGRADDQASDDHEYGDRRFSFNPQDVDDLDAGGYPAGAPSGARGWAASDAESTQVMGAGGRPAQGRRDQGRASAQSSASSRSGRARRSGEMSGKDWDSLSDVDYWAELASDKSLAATAEPAGPGRAGPDFPEPSPVPAGSRSERRSRSGRADAPLSDGPAARNEAALASDVTAVMPGRRHAPAGAPATPLLPGDSDARSALSGSGRPSGRGDRGLLADGPPARGAASGYRSRRSRDLPAAPRDVVAAPYGGARSRPARPAAPDPDPDPDGSIAALARLSGPRASGSWPAALDDDPLTSPSFPAVRDEDSRSYRSRRAEGQPAGPAGSAAWDSGPHSSGPHSSGSHSSDSQNSGSHSSGPQSSGSHSSGGYLPAAPAAAGYPAAAEPLAGFDDRPAGHGRRGRRARTDEYPGASPAGPPAPAPRRDYGDLPTTPGSPPPGNPYGSYVSSAGSPPAPARQDSDAYGSYVSSAGSPPAPARRDIDAYAGYGTDPEARYSQPGGRHLSPASPAPLAPSDPLSSGSQTMPGQPPLGYSGPSRAASGYAGPDVPAGDRSRAGGAHAVPVYAAPVSSGPPAAPEYGRSWPAAPGARAPEPYGPPARTYPNAGYPSGSYPNAGYPSGSYPNAGYPSGSYPSGDYPSGSYQQDSLQPGSYPAGGYPAGGYGRPDYPAAAYSGRQYDQSAYLPEATPGGQRDQNGYGSPDSGYGAGAYDGYPGY